MYWFLIEIVLNNIQASDVTIALSMCHLQTGVTLDLSPVYFTRLAWAKSSTNHSMSWWNLCFGM